MAPRVSIAPGTPDASPVQVLAVAGNPPRLYLVDRVGMGNDKGDGSLSFNKCVTAFSCAIFAWTDWYCLTRLRIVPPWYVWTFQTVVLGAGFGLKGYLGGMARQTANMAQKDSTALRGSLDKIMAKVSKRRDPLQGIEPPDDDEQLTAEAERVRQAEEAAA